MKGDKPCKVIDIKVSKTGKHGHAKCRFTAIDIFDGSKHEDIVPSTHTAHVPVVTRMEYQVIGLEDGYLQLMTDDGDVVKLQTIGRFQRETITVPEGPQSFEELDDLVPRPLPVPDLA